MFNYCVTCIGVLMLSYNLQICAKVPSTVAQLKRENKPDSIRSLHQLAELMHCLIALHPGFPELYDPIMDAIKVVMFVVNELMNNSFIKNFIKQVFSLRLTNF